MAPSTLPAPRFFREDVDDDSVPAYNWSQNNYLSHHCDTCQEPLNTPTAKRTCLGIHQICCERWHRTLFRGKKIEHCRTCLSEDAELAKRCKELATIKRDLVAAHRGEESTPEKKNWVAQALGKSKKRRNTIREEAAERLISPEEIELFERVLRWAGQSSSTRPDEPRFDRSLQQRNEKTLKALFGSSLKYPELAFTSKVFAMLGIEYSSGAKVINALRDLTLLLNDAIEIQRSNETSSISHRKGWFNFVPNRNEKEWRMSQAWGDEGIGY